MNRSVTHHFSAQIVVVEPPTAASASSSLEGCYGSPGCRFTGRILFKTTIFPSFLIF